MTEPHDEERWFAYFLDELPEHERGAVEAEMARAPERAAEVERLVGGVREWAQSPAPYAPYALAAETAPREVAGPMRVARLIRLPLGLAAAALFVFAVSQASFTIQVGDTQLSWGTPAAPSAPAPESAVVELAERLDTLETDSRTSKELLESLAVQTLVLSEQLEFAATNLAARQQEESLARHRDMEQLVALSQESRNVGLASWPEPSGTEE